MTASGRSITILGAVALIGPCAALLVAPGRPSCVAAPVPPVLRSRAIFCQEEPQIDEAKLGLVERAGDPFRVVRAVIYVTFGVTGLAGVVTSVMQMEQPDAMQNLAVNSGVLAAGVATFFLDRAATVKLREQTEAELKNPYLKKDLLNEPDEDD